MIRLVTSAFDWTLSLTSYGPSLYEDTFIFVTSNRGWRTTEGIMAQLSDWAQERKINMNILMQDDAANNYYVHHHEASQEESLVLTVTVVEFSRA